MKTSMNMTFMLMLFIFTIVFPSIESFQLYQQSSGVRPANPYEHASRFLDCFCALSCDGRRNFQSCVRQNGFEIVLEFAKNCAQQIQFYPTKEEVDDFLCNNLRSCPQEYKQFIICLGSADYTYSLNFPSTYKVVDSCLANADRC
ncbi:uncharacterized protein LOC111615756 [Centruroides sculpturatus]|uniref:uncharacterized protein LOC111615756 n=1 Tax=Centruroides sculpturatus TaxID=218467 RepID=UPI000C6DE10F|nr:uncharacterized protein LOC111615756 [Centruroides sculpturatus]